MSKGSAEDAFEPTVKEKMSRPMTAMIVRTLMTAPAMMR